MLAVVATAAFLFLHAPAARADCGGTASGATPCPPTPTPTLAFLSLDVTSGDATTVITVTGGQFLPNEQMSLYWDTTSHVAGFAQADSGGSFSTKVKPFPGDGPGGHKVCASVQPNPCAQFTINAAPSPSPTPSPSESPSPSASPEAAISQAPTPSPVAVSLSGFDVISRPPFVFLPIAGALGIALSLGYWVVSMMRRPRQQALPTAAVVHRAMRPDYSAGFGTPPPSPAQEAEPSAWSEPSAPHAPEAAPPAPEASTPPPPPDPQVPDVEWGEPVEWGTGSSDWGLSEPPQDDNPEAPPPAD